MNEIEITLADRAETWAFRRGTPVELMLTPGGEVVRMTRWQRFIRRVKNRILAPFRRKYVVTAVSQTNGTITVTEVPSWHRFL